MRKSQISTKMTKAITIKERKDATSQIFFTAIFAILAVAVAMKLGDLLLEERVIQRKPLSDQLSLIPAMVTQRLTGRIPLLRCKPSQF